MNTTKNDTSNMDGFIDIDSDLDVNTIGSNSDIESAEDNSSMEKISAGDIETTIEPQITTAEINPAKINNTNTVIAAPVKTICDHLFNFLMLFNASCVSDNAALDTEVDPAGTKSTQKIRI